MSQRQLFWNLTKTWIIHYEIFFCRNTGSCLATLSKSCGNTKFLWKSKYLDDYSLKISIVRKDNMFKRGWKNGKKKYQFCTDDDTNVKIHVWLRVVAS